MYCSISDAWNQENNMANLAKRFNYEHFSNNGNQQIEHFKVNNNQENYLSNSNYNNNLIESNNTQNIINRPKKEVNNNLVNNNLVEEKNIEENKCRQATKEFSCVELVDKVLSCDKCRQMILYRLNINNTSISDLLNNFLKGTNKEVIIAIGKLTDHAFKNLL